MADPPLAEDVKDAPAEIDTGSGAVAYRVTRTTPDVLRRHDISDEELTMLETGSRTIEQQIMWTSLGIFLSAAVPALEAFGKIDQNSSEFTLINLFMCLAFGVGFSVFLIMAYIVYRGPSSKNLAEAIRKRSATDVRSGQ